ncbi:hypothetical protein [Paractinoplanes rishiriensis]|nr:hypothetical protein [Actinoplanes rishiriensis]
MVFLFLFVFVVMMISALVVWPRVGGKLPVAAQPWRAEAGDGGGSAAAPAGWEGVLAAGRIRGEISQRDYVRAMEQLVSGEPSAGLPDRYRRGR